MYMTTGSQMSLIIGLIRPEQLELSVLELEKLLYLNVYTPASSNINQSAPDLFKICMAIQSQRASVIDLIGQEQEE